MFIAFHCFTTTNFRTAKTALFCTSKRWHSILFLLSPQFYWKQQITAKLTVWPVC